ncbi:MAG TPA: hypothetical protein VHM01_11980 [Alphaproteobacteria bacterium]|nr:hypothetical protein [Alphaproteobacteria bacterium]
MWRKTWKAIGAALLWLFATFVLDQRRPRLELAVVIGLAGIIAYLWITRGV